MKWYFRKIVNRKPWFPPKESASLSHKILRSLILDRFLWQIVLHQNGHTTMHDHPFDRHRIHNWLGHRSNDQTILTPTLDHRLDADYGRVSSSMLELFAGIEGDETGFRMRFEWDSNWMMVGGIQVGKCGKKDICDIGTLITLIEK